MIDVTQCQLSSNNQYIPRQIQSFESRLIWLFRSSVLDSICICISLIHLSKNTNTRFCTHSEQVNMLCSKKSENVCIFHTRCSWNFCIVFLFFGCCDLPLAVDNYGELPSNSCSSFFSAHKQCCLSIRHTIRCVERTWFIEWVERTWVHPSSTISCLLWYSVLFMITCMFSLTRFRLFCGHLSLLHCCPIWCDYSESLSLLDWSTIH